MSAESLLEGEEGTGLVDLPAAVFFFFGQVPTAVGTDLGGGGSDECALVWACPIRVWVVGLCMFCLSYRVR